MATTKSDNRHGEDGDEDRTRDGPAHRSGVAKSSGRRSDSLATATSRPAVGGKCGDSIRFRPAGLDAYVTAHPNVAPSPGPAPTRRQPGADGAIDLRRAVCLAQPPADGSAQQREWPRTPCERHGTASKLEGMYLWTVRTTRPRSSCPPRSCRYTPTSLAELQQDKRLRTVEQQVAALKLLPAEFVRMDSRIMRAISEVKEATEQAAAVAAEASKPRPVRPAVSAIVAAIALILLVAQALYWATSRGRDVAWPYRVSDAP